jgi:IS5 family transposase
MKAMRRRIALRKHFVQNSWQMRFRFASALGVRARTRAALVQRIVIVGATGEWLRYFANKFGVRHC